MAKDKAFGGKMSDVQINPLVIVGLVIVLLGGIGYFAILRPRMEESKTLAEFNTPEAQAKRDPDQKKVSPSLQNAIEAMRNKEQHSNTGNSHGLR